MLRNPMLFKKCKIINLNWFEKIDNTVQYLEKVLLIKFLKVMGKKIIYTVHNKQPHDTSNKFSFKMMKFLLQEADLVLGMCPETREVISSIAPESIQKLKYVLHPNYIYNYRNEVIIDYRKRFNFSDDDMVFLFLGFVSPYKNLELLIDTFKALHNEKIKLLIAGKPCNTGYEEKLVQRIDGSKNIITDFRYIPDKEIVSYYNTSSIVIMPYHKESSLNSGAVYLSFSLKRTVICPDIGTMKALKNHDFVYQYEYSDESEHPEKLRLAILKACEDYEQNPDMIIEKGEQAFTYVATEHSDECIGKMYSNYYRGLLKNA
jgi:glycosyltransferase involved in cell wall biosynthesis